MSVVTELGTDILVIGCDSTNVNTGTNGGAIHQLHVEEMLKLQWFICLLHTNELPLRHLFQKLDGQTSGSTTFSGPIGKAIQSCEGLSIVNFKPIVDGSGLPDMPKKVVEDLSRDQQYLYKIVNAIRVGVVCDDLARQKPGPINHSRWLTLACRVCRLYVATEAPHEHLQILTHFIVTNYGPNWFSIKCKPTCIDGPKHVFVATQLTKHLPPSVATIVRPYIARNAYFAHPENILLAMLADSDMGKRVKATDLIMKLRGSRHAELERSDGVRKFRFRIFRLMPQIGMI